MRILVYGFGPYRQFTDNITRKIINKLSPYKNFNKIVFPVRFHRKQFIEAIEKFRPEFVLGMGQCSRGRLIRIETRAVNKRRSQRGERGRLILQRGPKVLDTSLRLENLRIAERARSSRNAGDYVCNFSMYVMLDHLRRRYPGVRYGFIHVPHGYNQQSAVRFVLKYLTALEPEFRSRKSGSKERNRKQRHRFNLTL